MKKVLAILLVLVLAFSLVACGGGGNDGGGSSTPTPNSGGDGGGSTGGDGGDGGDSGAAWPAEIGYFDPAYDYSQHKTFKVAYMVAAVSFLYDEFDAAFRDWSKRMNINYTGMWAPAGGSADEYLSGIETYVDQGYTGFLLDADTNWYPSVMALCDKLGVAYISCMGQIRDYANPYMYNGTVVNGTLQGPYVGFDQVQFGLDMADKLMEWKNANHASVPMDKVGYISVDFTLSPQLHDRTNGAEMKWAEINPSFGEFSPDVTVNPNNFWIADVAAGAMDQATAQSMTTQIITANTDIEVWLISAPYDDLAIGAANAVENLGLNDVSCVTCIGGSSLIVQWDAGVDNAWRYAQFTAQSIYAEPILAALWAMMAGQVSSAEELWPDWRVAWDKGDILEFTGETDAIYGYPVVKTDADGKGIVTEEHNYPVLLLPLYWLEIDNYKEYLEWCDLYAYGEGDAGHYDYDQVTDLNLFSARIETPASYSTFPG